MEQKMYRCLNCGAEYDPGLSRCPYCGQENPEKAQEHYQKKITRLSAERRNLKNLPGIISRKVGSKLLACILGLVLLAIVGGAIAGVVTSVHRKLETARQQRVLEQMEELLRAEDYPGLKELCDAQEHAYLIYDKYDEVTLVYTRSLWLLDALKTCEEDQQREEDETFRMWNLAYAFERWNSLYEISQEYLNDESRRGNETYVQAILDQSRETMKSYLPVDDAFLDEIATMNESDYEKRMNRYEELALDMLLVMR